MIKIDEDDNWKDNIRKIWSRPDSFPLKKMMRADEFINLYLEWREANPEATDNKQFVKWLIDQHPEFFEIQESATRAAEKENNSSLMRRRDQAIHFTIGLHGIEKRDNSYSRNKEARERKEKWESGNWIIQRQKDYIKRSGLSNHLVSSGTKNPIQPLDSKQSRKYPRSTPEYSETTRIALDVNRETPNSIRAMSKELTDIPFRKWNSKQMEWASKHIEIANAIRVHQDQKKRDR